MLILIENVKSHLRHDLTYYIIISWQEFQFVKITFPELEKLDVQEIRKLLDEEVA